MIQEKCLRPLISDVALQVRIQELGRTIRKSHGDSPIVCVCVLKGAFFFAADLMRAIGGDVRIEFLHLRNRGFSNPTEISSRINYLSGELFNKRCLLVNDIVDTGHTLSYLMKYIRGLNPKSLSSAVLLDKPNNREIKINPDYIGFSIPDEFVVGYGLDIVDKYRNLDHIAAYTP